jgi:arylsulfatase A-like enzyme
MTEAGSRPDIVFIVLDTLRADRLSCYGHAAETTPHIDAFAASGVLFERAISPAQWTIPAHGSLFTGEFPTTHGTTQIYDKHSVEQTTLAEHLARFGYRTVGFCNNPLLGIIENDLDRGFQEFYNYGGVLPNRPDISGRPPDIFRQAAALIRGQLSRLNEPIQSVFTRDHKLLNLFLHPWLVALWERNINFKGNTRQSIHDIIGYLTRHHQQPDAPPLFTYLNLMETHLPYRPPLMFSRKFAPSFWQERQARLFMQSFNYKTYDWIAPITTPFTETQHRILNEMYNAEVAYEDHVMRSLLTYLDQPRVRDNTLVIIASDHGEGLDHHSYVGHSLVAYEDLIRVPLILRYPPHYPAGKRVTQPVSTRRIFHTALEAAGATTVRRGEGEMDIRPLSLRQSLNGHAQAHDWVWTEAYPPLTLVRLIESRNPEAVESHRCLAVRRAIYDGTQKLVTVDETAAELYDVEVDPSEALNRIDADPETAQRLDQQLQHMLASARSRQAAGLSAPGQFKLDDSRRVSERLRRLGYIE